MKPRDHVCFWYYCIPNAWHRKARIEKSVVSQVHSFFVFFYAEHYLLSTYYVHGRHFDVHFQEDIKTIEGLEYQTKESELSFVSSEVP